MSQPPDPVSPLAAGMAQAHEIYLTLIGSGFTESQALYLLGQILAASATGRPG